MLTFLLFSCAVYLAVCSTKYWKSGIWLALVCFASLLQFLWMLLVLLNVLTNLHTPHFAIPVEVVKKY